MCNFVIVSDLFLAAATFPQNANVETKMRKIGELSRADVFSDSPSLLRLILSLSVSKLFLVLSLPNAIPFLSAVFDSKRNFHLT